eukprot:COSAG02_NODE_24578_length_682_cov_4.486301_1_plen_102_part_01
MKIENAWATSARAPTVIGIHVRYMMEHVSFLVGAAARAPARCKLVAGDPKFAARAGGAHTACICVALTGGDGSISNPISLAPASSGERETVTSEVALPRSRR